MIANGSGIPMGGFITWNPMDVKIPVPIILAITILVATLREYFLNVMNYFLIAII
jgi:hypothetical protein